MIDFNTALASCADGIAKLIFSAREFRPIADRARFCHLLCYVTCPLIKRACRPPAHILVDRVLAHRFRIGRARPNSAHLALARLETSGRSELVLAQNVDRLQPLSIFMVGSTL